MTRISGTTRATIVKFWNLEAPRTPRRFSRVKITIIPIAMAFIANSLREKTSLKAVTQAMASAAMEPEAVMAKRCV